MIANDKVGKTENRKNERSTPGYQRVSSGRLVKSERHERKKTRFTKCWIHVGSKRTDNINVRPGKLRPQNQHIFKPLQNKLLYLSHVTKSQEILFALNCFLGFAFHTLSQLEHRIGKVNITERPTTKKNVFKKTQKTYYSLHAVTYHLLR